MSSTLFWIITCLLCSQIHMLWGYFWDGDYPCLLNLSLFCLFWMKSQLSNPVIAYWSTPPLFLLYELCASGSSILILGERNFLICLLFLNFCWIWEVIWPLGTREWDIFLGMYITWINILGVGKYFSFGVCVKQSLWWWDGWGADFGPAERVVILPEWQVLTAD